MKYRYDQIDKRIPYMNENRNIGVHIGQLKLLFSEVFFISKFLKMNPKKVVYVGAGSDGYHNTYLSKMFPQIQFDLWDPGKFNVEERPNIKIYNKFFNDSEAKKYEPEGKDILFMSDIRNLSIANERDNFDKSDKIVMADMNNQMRWVKLIKPIASFLKFRLPYITKSFDYFTGKIYMQPYSPITSEARIIVKNIDKIKTYDANEYDEKMSYFNNYIRYETKEKRWTNIMNKYNIINNWDNSFAFYILRYYLKKTNKPNNDEDVASLFMDIIDFYRKLNKTKADNLFNKN